MDTDEEVDRMSRLQVTSKAFALLACSVLLFASIGCSPGTPTDPSSTPQNVVVSPNFVRILSTSDKSVDQPYLVIGTTSKMISAEDGGVITNGRVTLEFPPFALSEDTEITIDMLDDEILGVELGPHGIQFNKPVIMTTDLRGTSAENMTDVNTLWYNEQEQWWETVEEIEFSDPNVVGATLLHFSKYAENIGG
ncbi:MAG: hypothetical protein AMS22_12345 [Thiotrichales bacterium SG8_50]|nr:MAG: hypothetical protein AMS22_12345 [Thiotrichales bacterium SG8_50]